MRTLLARLGPACAVAAAAALALSASAHAAPPRASASIVGGQSASASAWPSIAFILAGWDGDRDGEVESIARCTGTVVAPSWVISAAHCAFRPDGAPVDAMAAVLGVADVNDPAGEAIRADRVAVDPNWDPARLHGDALLLHLATPTSRPPMALARAGTEYVSEPGVPNAAGWGTTDEASQIGTDVLREAYLELQSDDTCARFARGFDAATQTCAGTYEAAGACHGDSGGPLIVHDPATGEPVLWGLTSFGPQLDLGMLPCELHAPAVFSWLPGFADFVASQLGGASGPGAGSATGTPAPPRGTPQSPVITPPRDRTAPVLSRVRLSRRSFRVTRRGGATLSFRLSEPAAVRVLVRRRVGGRYKTLAPTAPFTAPAGQVTRRFSGRLGRRVLRPGRYRLELHAVDTAGNAGKAARVSFRIVR